MQEKRRDTKGRLLRNGEVQRPDGQYMFRYIDGSGVRRAVYSWRLVNTDGLPDGKRTCPALRDLERGILRDLEDNIKSYEADRKTIDQMFNTFMMVRADLKDTTKYNYKVIYDSYILNELGYKSLGSIKSTHIQSLYFDLADKGYKFSTIQSVNSILCQIFEEAVADNIIRTNPCVSAMKNLRRKMDTEQNKRHALTVEEQGAFIQFVASTPRFERYTSLFTVLLGTGMRIGEALGLRWSDLDFDEGFISVDHTLVYKPAIEGKYEFRVTSPKTKAGIRIIPMFDDVKRAFQREKRVRRDPNLPIFSIGEYTGFVFVNTQGKPWQPNFIFDVIQRAVKAYNKEQDEIAEKTGTEPVYLPRFSAHILRHAFCTRFCENEADLKVIQEVMGHSDIKTTMNVYHEATKARKLESFKNLEGKFRIA